MTLSEGGSEEKHDDNFTEIPESNLKMDDRNEEIKELELLAAEEKIRKEGLGIFILSIFYVCIL